MSMPTGFDAAAAGRLQRMDGHFWMRGRRHLVARLLRRIGATAGSVVEFGCGTGTLLRLLEDGSSRVVGLDAHMTLLERALDRSNRAELFQADVTRTGLENDGFGLVVALDVIEHVDPDAFLTEARRVASSDGLLLISAPAAPSLWSRMDEKAGHRCRYTRKLMESELRRNGWRPLGFTHYQFLLFPIVWLSKNFGARDDEEFERAPPKWLDRILGAINFLEVAVLGRYSLRHGSSIFMWATPVEECHE